MTELRTGWQRVKFGEVVRLNKETCKDPAAAGIERVIGLEHLEPGDLRVRSWADVADGTTFTNRVRPGQVLFGKRRAYQRKVAVADFDAVCSGDIYVLESADQERLLPGLLPFICQTDAFFEHAVGTSAGSLSPRTNWRKLAEHEFSLPPLVEQHGILECLLHSTSVHHASDVALDRAMALKQSVIDHAYHDLDWSKPLSSIVCAPITYGIVQAGPHVENGVPYIRVSDMTGAKELSPHGMLCTSSEIAERYKRSAVVQGDLVVALRGVAGRTMVVPPSLEGANLTQGTARVRVSPEHSPLFFFYAMQSTRGKTEIRKRLRGWKGESLLEITLGELRDLPIPVPKLESQSNICSIIASSESAEKLASEKLAAARSFAKSLLCKVLELRA